ncbi:ATP12 family protein [Mesorhizobium sp. CAU 1741]|uniref:ATP12 family chaperone protein n=1 Tax=Mesorhizobium sp. CAU 1741 TaxID=3140366 RepID=UPI00325B3066
MRDLLNDLEAGHFLSDPDPVRRAQIQMRQPLPKRFYKAATVAETPEGHSVQLDGKPIRTPGRAQLLLPTGAAAALVAGEFEAQKDTIDPVTMPVLRLANTAIDGVASDMQAVLEDVMRFSSSDMLCYRADSPDALVSRQAEAWDPVLDWAHATLGARFFLAEGVMHVEQPREAIAAVGLWLRQREEPFRLSAIHLMTTLTGSALIALATEARAIDPDTAWTAAHVDEDWTIEHWGEDAEASLRRALRRRDFDAAVALARSVDATA